MNSYFKENKEIYQIYNLFHIEEILSYIKEILKKLYKKRVVKNVIFYMVHFNLKKSHQMLCFFYSNY